MNKRLILWLAAAVIAVIVVGTLAMSAQTQTVRKDIGGAELLQLQGSGASIVDVRTPPEFEAGHIASAINVPLDQLQMFSPAWDKKKPVVVYCATGARSVEAATYLAGAGFKKVYDLTGGLVAWTGELVSGKAAAAAPAGAGAVKTDGKPIFIEFATST
jgi:rhodanese-related sulfurtransferase